MFVIMSAGWNASEYLDMFVIRSVGWSTSDNLTCLSLCLLAGMLVNN